jgi:hypothetical protein
MVPNCLTLPAHWGHPLLLLNQERSHCQVRRLRTTNPDDHASSSYARIRGGGRCRVRQGLGGFPLHEVLEITKGEPGCAALAPTSPCLDGPIDRRMNPPCRRCRRSETPSGRLRWIHRYQKGSLPSYGRRVPARVLRSPSGKPIWATLLEGCRHAGVLGHLDEWSPRQYLSAATSSCPGVSSIANVCRPTFAT